MTVITGREEGVSERSTDGGHQRVFISRRPAVHGQRSRPHGVPARPGRARLRSRGSSYFRSLKEMTSPLTWNMCRWSSMCPALQLRISGMQLEHCFFILLCLSGPAFFYASAVLSVQRSHLSRPRMSEGSSGKQECSESLIVCHCN